MRTSMILLVTAALLVGATVRAQDPAVDAGARLRALLRELARTDDAAWKQQLDELEQRRKAASDEANKLREQAAALTEQAKAKDAASEQLRAEIERLQQLRALVGTLPRDAAAPKPPAAPKPMPEVRDDAAKTDAPKVEPPKIDAKVAPPSADVVVFARDIAPLFEQHCIACHDADDDKGGLDLSSFATAKKGGGSGRTILAGEPDQSRLYQLVAHQERPFMPKDADALPADAVATIRRWIEQGAGEDAAAARAFAADKQQQQKALAAEASATKEVAGPVPQSLPPLAVRTFARPAAIKSLARSRTAPVLAMPGNEQVLLFDAAMAPLGALPLPWQHCDVVAFSGDGARLLCAGGEPGKSGGVALFDVATGERVAAFSSEKDIPLAIALDRSGDRIAIGGSSKRTRLFDRDGTERFAAVHDDFVLALAFTADGTLLAAADRSGVVQLWETATGRLDKTLRGHDGAVNAIAIRGNKLLVTAGQDGTVRGFDLDSGKEQWRQSAHQGPALAVAIGSEDRIASCGSDGRIRIFASGGKPIARSEPTGDWLYAIAWGAATDSVHAGDWQGRVHTFDIAKKKLSARTPLATAQ